MDHEEQAQADYAIGMKLQAAAEQARIACIIEGITNPNDIEARMELARRAVRESE